MKNIILILSLLIIVSGVLGQAPANTAETPVPVATQTANQPSAQDIQNAKEILQKLTNEGKAPTQGQQKSVADVLDKGVDIFSGYVTTLEGVVSKYAPEVWRIMIRQQYAEAIGYPLFWGLMLILVLTLYKILRVWYGIPKGDSMFKEQPDEACDESYGFRVGASIVLLIVGFIFSIIFLNYLTEGIMIAINPEYYALKDIIHLLK